MIYAYTVLHVNNVEKSVHFYKNAFGFECKYLDEKKSYAELHTGETTLVFAENRMGDKSNNANSNFNKTSKDSIRVELAFVSNDIVNDYNTAIRYGAKVHEELQKKPWGQWSAYIIDINGFLIGLSTVKE